MSEHGEERRMIAIPENQEDVLSYVAALFDLDESDVPSDCIVILSMVGKIDEQDEHNEKASGMYFRYRIGGEGVTSSTVGLLDMVKYEILYEANPHD